MKLKILKIGNLMGTPDAKEMLQRIGPGTEAAHQLWNELAEIKFAFGYNGQCTTTLLLEPDLPEAYPALVDPSYLTLSGEYSVAGARKEQLRALEAAGVAPGEVRSILVTHAHPDHYDPGLVEMLPGAALYAPAASGLPGVQQFDARALGPALEALDTPGHGGPHLSYLVDLASYDLTVCLAGDLIMSQAHYLDRRHPLAFADHRAGEESIEKMRAALQRRGRKFSMVFPGHGLPFFLPRS